MPFDHSPLIRSQPWGLYYPLVVISDLHLGKEKVVEADLLLEFLHHVKCDMLILNGDIIDGWYLEKHKHRPFPERHANVIDAINRKAGEGTRIIYIPGNHDERLRYPSYAQMQAKRLSKHEKDPQFHRDIVFRDKYSGVYAPIEFRSDMILRDFQGRAMKVLHGDQFDPPWVEGKLAKVGDYFYDHLVVANANFARLYKKFKGNTRFSFAKLLKKNTKDAVGIIKNFELAAISLPDDIDGMICGHIHHAEIAMHKDKLYVNSGDWIESCTASVHNENGTWQTLHWDDLRQQIDICPQKMKEEQALDYAYRPITNQQLRIAQRLWPAKDVRAKKIRMTKPFLKKKKVLEAA